MDSSHAMQISRPRLRAKDFSGGASTKRTIRMLRKSLVHELQTPSSSSRSEISRDAKTTDHGKEETLPPLQDPSNIRLITVLPELREGLPQCLVSVHSIDEPFMTLSYTWGPSTTGHTIWLNKIKINVRCHLWQFLLVASRNFPNVLIWIDALCIDQLNTSERSEQVRRMGDIYAASNKTLTFLAGTECAVSDTRPGTTQDVHHLRDLDRDVQKSLQALKAREEIRRRDVQSSPSGYEAFDEGPLVAVLRIIFIIVCNAYWARLWIIQENVLSGASNMIIVSDVTVSFTELSSLVTYICSTYKDDMRGQSETELHILDKASADFNEYQQPASQEVLHQGSDDPPDTTDGWIAEILECITDPTRNGLITVDFLPLALSHSPELDRHDFLHLMLKVQTSLCADRRDKIYGLRTFQKSSDRFPIDYSEDVYCLYFRACRYFEGVNQEKQHTPAATQTVIIQAISASLDLGVLDLVFGDDSERTMLATMIREESMSEHVRNLNITGFHTPADVNTDIFLLCKHCQRCVAVGHEYIGKLWRCVVQCHRQLHDPEEVTDDHYIIRVGATEYNCRVEQVTSWINPGHHPVSTTLLAINDRMRLSLDQVSWLVYLDELFRLRPSHDPMGSSLIESLRTGDEFGPPFRDFGKKSGLHSNVPDNPGWRRGIRRFLRTDNLKRLDLDGRAEERLVQCLHGQLSLDLPIMEPLADSEWEHLFQETMYGHLNFQPHYHHGEYSIFQ